MPPITRWILLIAGLFGSIQARSAYSRLSTLQLLQQLRPIQPPHCSRALVTQAGSSFLHGSSNRSSRMKLNLGVGQTVCFRTASEVNATYDDIDLFHTVTLERLEQYHAITQRYRFSIPELETTCICECQADAQTCRASDYNFGACGGGREVSGRPTACYRTFFSDQPSNGCPSGHAEEPKLCCELKFRPFQDRSYTAVKLEPPSTFAVVQYVAYAWNEKGRWDEADRRTIRVHLDGGTQLQFLDSHRRLELGVSAQGKTSNQLEPGMYFVENLGAGMYGHMRRMPLNEITEHSFEKLGWFRVGLDGQAQVQGGFVLMDKIHRAKAEHCVEQRYQSILDANFYVNRDSLNSTTFSLSEPLELQHHWIKSARMVGNTERHAVITENEGTNLEISLATQQIDSKLVFMHNASRVADFNALILVDKLSNSMLNISVLNATGILHGFIKHVSDSLGTTVDSFTIQVPKVDEDVDQHVLVRIKPYEVNTQHIVCLRPDDGDALEMCKQVVSVHFDLETNTVHNEWRDSTGACQECNQFSVNGFLQSLNPVAWIRDIHSMKDGLMLVVDLGAFLLMVFLIYIIVFKVVMPVLRCMTSPVSCITNIFTKGSKKTGNKS